MFGTGIGAFFPLMVYLLAIIGSIVSIVRPIVGVMILALILPLQSGRYRLLEYPLGSRVLILLLLFTAIGVMMNRGYSIFPPKPMRLIVTALCVVTYLSLWIGPALLSSIPWPIETSTMVGRYTPFGNWIMYMHLPALFVLVCATVKDKRQMQVLLLVMMIGFLWNMKSFYLNTGHRDADVYIEALRGGVGSDFGGPNGRAAFATQCTLFLLALFGSISSWKVRLIVAFLLFAGTYSVLFSYSRGAWLGFLFGVVYLGIFRMRWLLVVGLVLAPFGTILLPNSVIQRATMTYEEGELDYSSGDRIEIWKHALKTTANDPILGVGFDSYRYYRSGEELLDTHNMYVKALVETGVIGLSCVIIFFVSAFRLGHRLAGNAKDPFFKALGAGFAAYMVSVVITNIFGDRWTYVDLSAYTWILLGLVVQATLWNAAPPVETPAAAVTTPIPIGTGAARPA